MPIRGDVSEADGRYSGDLVPCWYNGYRLYLKKPEQVKMHSNGWQLQLPKDHYSAGYAISGGWDWSKATELADADAKVLEQWRQDLGVFTEGDTSQDGTLIRA